MKLKMIFVLLGTLLLSACSTMFMYDDHEHQRSSSLVKYLYPDGDYPEHKPEIPTLKLPVTVGIAFIPSAGSRRVVLDSNDESELLEGVRESFLQYQFIDRIETIPSTYLAQGKGFGTIEQVARLYDVDVMALVSYDQVSRSSQNAAALFYLTIVGAYFIPGNSNVTQTFVDTAVFDVATRKLLFRAPGTDRVDSDSSAAKAPENFRENSVASYHNAVSDMTTNLDMELSSFKNRIAEDKQNKVAKVTYRPGYYSGGGSVGPFTLLAFLLIIVSSILRRRITP